MELVGLFEVAEMAGVSRQTVVNWRARFPDFPNPVVELASGPVWHREEIGKWLKMREGNMEAIAIKDAPTEKVKSHEVGVSGFDSLDISSAIKAEITCTPEFSVRVLADDAVFNRVDTKLIGSVLKIRLKPAIWFHYRRVRVLISMPRLLGVRVSGASDVTADGFSANTPLEIKVSGASKVRLKDITAGETDLVASGASNIYGDITSAKCQVQSSGASTVELNGQGETLKLVLSGASSALLSKFHAKDADMRLTGASHASININGKLDATLSGASKLTYDGTVTMGKLQITGASALKQA